MGCGLRFCNDGILFLENIRLKWGVVIPAGGLVTDPLATAISTPKKALADVHGRPSVVRVVEAVLAAGFSSDEIVVVGSEEVRAVLGDRAMWADEVSGPIANAWAGVEKLGVVDGVMFLPSDAPFLTGEGVRHFGESVFNRLDDPRSDWFAAGMCPHADWESAYPDWPNPHLKLKDGDFVSGAYFATSLNGFFSGAEFFTQVAQSRKSQFQMLLKIGIWPMIRYALHQVSIAEAEMRLGKLLGGQAVIVADCDVEGMVDIDSPEDYANVLRYWNREN